MCCFRASGCGSCAGNTGKEVSRQTGRVQDKISHQDSFSARHDKPKSEHRPYKLIQAGLKWLDPSFCFLSFRLMWAAAPNLLLLSMYRPYCSELEYQQWLLSN